MVLRENLTNEKLKDKFPSQFELVGYAIELATNMVHSGRGPRVKTTIENPAVIVLDEITQGKDILDDIPREVVFVEAATSVFKSSDHDTEKAPEKKPKSRRILQ